MSCPFAVDDGVYVLGALAPSERAEFERHLASCSACRDAVANLAVLPGLLSRLDAAAATTTGTPRAELRGTTRSLRPDQLGSAGAKLPPSLLDRMLTTAAREREAQRRGSRVRRLRYIVAACVAAIVLGAGVGVGVHALEGRDTTVAQRPMAPAAGTVPVSAEIGVTPIDGGSRIVMTCRYPDMNGGPWTVRLAVVARSSPNRDQVGSVTASAGEEYSLIATTYLSPDEIDHIELQRADQTPLLTWTPS
jgi:anti-sigma factor RsiW